MSQSASHHAPRPARDDPFVGGLVSRLAIAAAAIVAIGALTLFGWG